MDLDTVGGLGTAARRRLEALVARRRDADGYWLVTSQRTRDQSRNLEDALRKVREVVQRALVAPRPRKPTGPSLAARRRRLESKRRRGSLKRERAARGEI